MSGATLLGTKRRRLLAVASAGGHWIQLSRLHPLFDRHDVHFVTTFKGTIPPIAGAPLTVVKDASRQDKIALLVLTLQLLGLLIRHRPDVVISTGAAPGYLALRLGKLLGARTIWLDSIANVEELSLSGKLAAGCADLWLTQWPHLTEKYERLQCKGAVL
jgi:UDP-N-acetylglucosamine:LPS N-acetylglucosamine transferase